MLCNKRNWFALLFISCAILSAQNLVASTLIKSIDKQGNVTYSDKPVPDSAVVSTVPIISGPSKSEIDEAQQQADKNINAAKKVDEKNKAELDKQKMKQPSSQNSSTTESEEINSETQKKYYYGSNPNSRPPIKRPRPPINRPGIKPPLTKPSPRR